MKTLVIYDNDGKIFSQVGGIYTLPQGGVQYLEVDVPDGEIIVTINTSVEPHQAVLEYKPLSETEILKKQTAMQEQAIADLTMYIATIGV